MLFVESKVYRYIYTLYFPRIASQSHVRVYSYIGGFLLRFQEDAVNNFHETIASYHSVAIALYIVAMLNITIRACIHACHAIATCMHIITAL